MFFSVTTRILNSHLLLSYEDFFLCCGKWCLSWIVRYCIVVDYDEYVKFSQKSHKMLYKKGAIKVEICNYVRCSLNFQFHIKLYVETLNQSLFLAEGLCV